MGEVSPKTTSILGQNGKTVGMARELIGSAYIRVLELGQSFRTSSSPAILRRFTTLGYLRVTQPQAPFEL